MKQYKTKIPNELFAEKKFNMYNKIHYKYTTKFNLIAKSFKILNVIYPSNELFCTGFHWDYNICVFCKKYFETVEYIFFQFEIEQEVWLSFESWIHPLNVMSVKPGVFLKESNFVINY